MTHTQFLAIIADIEKNMEGEGYWIEVFTLSGRSFEGSWQWLGKNYQSSELIVLSGNNEPPTYIPLSKIESIQLGR